MIIMGLSVVLTMAIGDVYIPPLEIVSLFGSKLHLCETPSPPHETIIFQVRIPRILLGLLVGFALATAGTTMQGLLKNPMADPYIIGIASGAAVGATLSITFLPHFLSVYTTPFMAFLGAVFATFLVYNIARVGGRIPVDTLLLTGIAINLFFSAILSFMMFRTSHDLEGIFFWLMGGLWLADWFRVKIILLPISFGIIVTYFFARDLNAMLLGEESAQHLGIEVENVKRILLVLSAFITAFAVSFVGTIGFVGLIIPHITRILVGPDHRILFPASALVGGIFLVWTDALARLLGEMPVGIITAFFGAPFFVYLLRSRRGGYYARS
jgi:iron complex transport system permease protein